MKLPASPWPQLILALVALACYGRVVDFDFVNYDDNVYFTDNPMVQAGLTAESVEWAFGIHGPSMWVPLTWLSHQAMISLFGHGPAPHHALNLLLHAANAVLVFLALKRLTRASGRSFAAALLFAIHPIHVESVAWITERKDVLSMFFCLLALLAYERHARGGGWRWFPLVMLCHALAVMAKPLAVTLPCVMLLLDAWPLQRRARWRMSLLEKLPLLAITAVACWLTILCQQAAGALSSGAQLPLAMRLANAVTSYAIYLRRLFLPTDLAVVYPYPDEIPEGVVGATAVLLLITLAAAMLRRKEPALTVGWLWFLGTLVPMIGLVQAGGSKMADRYAYFTFVGLYIMLAWGAVALGRQVPRLRQPLAIAAGAWLLILLALGARQLGYWKDSRHLFERAVAVTDRPYLAHNNLGLALRDEGRIAEAEGAFLKSLEIRPRYAEARNNLGILHASHGDPFKARTLLDQVVAAEPDHAIAWHNLGKVHATIGDAPRARICFENAIRLKPDFSDPRYDLGTFLIGIRDWPGAIAALEPLVELAPDHANGWINLGVARSSLGDGRGAESAYLTAIELGSPLGRHNLFQHRLQAGRFGQAAEMIGNDPELQLKFGSALRQAGHLTEARQALDQLVREHPGYAEAHHEIGLLLGQQGRHRAARSAFQHTLQLNPGHPAAGESLRQARAAENAESAE